MSTQADRFVQAFGDAANRSGVLSELAGKIFAALYLSPSPLSLDEICDNVGASKSNVSVQVRELLTLAMVRRAGIGGRRHYYEASTDLWSIATEVIGRRLEQEARSLLSEIQQTEPALASSSETSDAVKARLVAMRMFLQLAIGMVESIRKGGAPDIVKISALSKS